MPRTTKQRMIDWLEMKGTRGLPDIGQFTKEEKNELDQLVKKKVACKARATYINSKKTFYYLNPEKVS